MKPEDHDVRSDEDLVARFQASGDQEMFVLLWRRHWARIYRQCLAFTGNPAGAEDLTARVFTLAWRQIQRFRSGNFSAWLAVIARNCCINDARSAWSRLVTPAGDEITAMADQHQEQGGSREDGTFSAELEQLVNQLPDEQRVAVKLFFIDGYSYEEIAGVMKCEVKAVKSYLQNGKRKLQILWGATSGSKEGV